MKTINLTSPLTSGPEVKKLQNLLKKNPYGSFYRDKIDGVFGTYTANSVKSAKYWLGYPENEIKAFAGDPLSEYLEGKRELPILYKARRKSRLKKYSQNPSLRLREGALASAIPFIGVKELPAGSNIVMFSQWYGLIGAWCAMFVTYNYTQAGSKAFDKNAERWAYCPFLLADARAGRNWVKEVSAENVQPGDVVLYDWDKDKVADHVGIFEAWTDKKKTKFTAIEGNTSATDNSNGGEVARQSRTKSNVIAFVRVLK